MSLKSFLLILIVNYKKYLSPVFRVLGFSNCRYTPTCSEYSMLAIKKYGGIRGLILAFKRIVRCQPFGGLGLDLVP